MLMAVSVPQSSRIPFRGEQVKAQRQTEAYAQNLRGGGQTGGIFVASAQNPRKCLHGGHISLSPESKKPGEPG